MSKRNTKASPPQILFSWPFYLYMRKSLARPCSFLPSCVFSEALVLWAVRLDADGVVRCPSSRECHCCYYFSQMGYLGPSHLFISQRFLHAGAAECLSIDFFTALLSIDSLTFAKHFRQMCEWFPFQSPQLCFTRRPLTFSCKIVSMIFLVAPLSLPL